MVETKNDESVCAKHGSRKLREVVRHGDGLGEKGLIPLAVALIIAGAVLIAGAIIAYKPVVSCQIQTAKVRGGLTGDASVASIQIGQSVKRN